ncbi:hypothetical protein E0L93_03990 [Rubrobacter taiwanensis]|uniref:DUF3006 domain-containing protein n=1 Tax=Rubrobacter taiwanensis TaxID=185139 RepID=A0A4R1BQV7_9ACTN|nr:hypothetical protein [Rubrobacter taiwanensis]TCJ19677.1 hypothetical protein E0L93_03990 [Rubrobacter taiwanensis]
MALTATVTGFDGGNVTMLIGEREIVVDRSELPEDIGQGDVLRLEFSVERRTMKDTDTERGSRPGEED